jgi:hypothetical protein
MNEAGVPVSAPLVAIIENPRAEGEQDRERGAGDLSPGNRSAQWISGTADGTDSHPAPQLGLALAAPR